MAQVKSKNTSPELIVRRFLHSHGFRYGLHNKTLPGTPDIVLRKFNTVIFVHGCFWHGHRCNKGRLPKTRTSWWSKKREYNHKKDRKNQLELKNLGWKVVIVWQCDLTSKRVQKELTALRKKLSIRDVT
jgi:DNA mismatch endonuclease (patch repair protein)